MKKFVLIFTMVLAMSVGAFAYDFTGVYLAPKIMYGYAIFDDIQTRGTNSGKDTVHDSSVIGGGLSLGYDYFVKGCTPIRTEFEYANFATARGDNYNNGVHVRQKVHAQTVMFNAFWDMHNRTAITPYLGAGIGVAFLNSKGRCTIDGADSYGLCSNSETNLAWNGAVGFSIDFTEAFVLDIGYRFAMLGDAKTKRRDVGTASYQNVTENYNMHQVALGARFTF